MAELLVERNMLGYIRVQGRGPVEDVKVRLGPITIFVGPNATGKTTVLRAIAEKLSLTVWCPEHGSAVDWIGGQHGTILLDNPEQGRHPGKSLEEVGDAVLNAFEAGKQVIFATHSPLLLDRFHPGTLRIFRFDERGKTEVWDLSHYPDFNRRFKGWALGEVVYGHGEEALVEEIRELERRPDGQ